MTTFDFSIHAAPGGQEWQRKFTNDTSPPMLLDLAPHGISGWGAHSAFVTWADIEGVQRYTPDWCLHVAECSRMQLSVLLVAFAKALPGVDEVALRTAVSRLPGEQFVLQILEF